MHVIPEQVKKVFDGFIEPMSTLDSVIAKLESDLGKKPVTSPFHGLKRKYGH